MEVRVPYLENGYYPGLKDISKRKGRRLIKTHLPQNLLPESVKQNKSRIIYIYRNPKDVIVSYYYFVRMMKYSNYKGTLDKFARSFMSDAVPYSPYFQHISGYHKLKEQTPENVLIVAYEDLKVNTYLLMKSKLRKYFGKLYIINSDKIFLVNIYFYR